MGAAFSGGSLCRMVGGVEIVVSSVIIAFAGQTLRLFYQMDGTFRHDFERIQYSAATAITQGCLTIFISLLLFIASKENPGSGRYLDVADEDSEAGDLPDPKGDTTTSTSSRRPSSLAKPSGLKNSSSHMQRVKRKLSLIYKLWLSFSLLSIGLLLIVFLCSMSYCIQTDADRHRYDEITDGGRNPLAMEDGKNKIIEPCFAEMQETINLRVALGDLYSYCLVNVFTLAVFMFVVYYQLKRVNNWGRGSVGKEDKQRVLPLPEPSQPHPLVEEEKKEDTTKKAVEVQEGTTITTTGDDGQ